MPKIRHPLSGSVYDIGEDGLVVVEKDGRTGRFDREGNWIDGDIRTADPELCRWISDPRATSRHRPAVEVDVDVEVQSPKEPTAPLTTGAA